ncbi:MAG: hypothetical protein ACI9OJ_000258 [Myxococcota bacterium]|jgi:uncharacterized protein (DUF934 family)
MRDIRPDQMIVNGEIADATWSLNLETVDSPGATTAVPLAQWLTLQPTERASTGLVLQGDDDLASVLALAATAPIIALHFPKFTDGRCYSHAYRLRRPQGYAGPLLAFGDVLRDQLPYMSRCGIHHFYPRADQDLAGCIQQLGHFTKHYQYSASVPGNA